MSRAYCPRCGRYVYVTSGVIGEHWHVLSLTPCPGAGSEVAS